MNIDWLTVCLSVYVCLYDWLTDWLIELTCNFYFCFYCCCTKYAEHKIFDRVQNNWTRRSVCAYNGFFLSLSLSINIFTIIEWISQTSLQYTSISFTICSQCEKSTYNKWMYGGTETCFSFYVMFYLQRRVCAGDKNALKSNHISKGTD